MEWTPIGEIQFVVFVLFVDDELCCICWWNHCSICYRNICCICCISHVTFGCVVIINWTIYCWFILHFLIFLEFKWWLFVVCAGSARCILQRLAKRHFWLARAKDNMQRLLKLSPARCAGSAYRALQRRFTAPKFPATAGDALTLVLIWSRWQESVYLFSFVKKDCLFL